MLLRQAGGYSNRTAQRGVGSRCTSMSFEPLAIPLSCSLPVVYAIVAAAD
jgi:hypothetical protein